MLQLLIQIAPLLSLSIKIEFYSSKKKMSISSFLKKVSISEVKAALSHSQSTERLKRKKNLSSEMAENFTERWLCVDSNWF